MTDQSQPDRQNGDGLLPCPFCGNAPVIMEYNFVFHAFCQPCGCTLEAEKWNTRTQPARDAAEGMERDVIVLLEHAVECLQETMSGKTSKIQTAISNINLVKNTFRDTSPPKPAPDAVREAQIRRNYADSATHAAIATACEVACAGGSAQDVVKALRERFSTPVPPADGAPEPFAWVVLSDVTGNTRMWTRNGDIAKAFAAKHLLKCVELYATPPVRGDRETAREIVTEWLGMFDPPPQIDFQQSEFLQAAIASALGIARTALPVQPGAGERE